MDPKNKTLIPLIIIFFVVGIAVGYVAHKPVTIEKPVEVEKIVTVTVTVTPTPAPATPTPTPTPTPITTPSVSDFTVKDFYNPDTDIPCYGCIITVEGYYTVNPTGLSIHPGQSVLIKTSQSFPEKLWLALYDTANCSPCLPPYQKYLGSSGAAFITFNNKGTYSFKTETRSSEQGVLPTPFTTNTTITVY